MPPPLPQTISLPNVRVEDDFALMAAIDRRDPSALARLHDRYSGAVFGFCLRALHDPGDAEDLLVDIFSELWERCDRFDAARGSPIGHIMGLTRSRVVDRLRSRKSANKSGLAGASDINAASGISGTEQEPLAAVIDAEQRQRVLRAMAELPDEQRQPLEMAFFEAMSHSEIAARLGQPLGTVKSRIRQAMARLRESLAPGE